MPWASEAGGRSFSIWRATFGHARPLLATHGDSRQPHERDDSPGHGIPGDASKHGREIGIEVLRGQGPRRKKYPLEKIDGAEGNDPPGARRTRTRGSAPPPGLFWCSWRVPATGRSTRSLPDSAMHHGTCGFKPFSPSRTTAAPPVDPGAEIQDRVPLSSPCCRERERQGLSQ